jgi:hypothetical protein
VTGTSAHSCRTATGNQFLSAANIAGGGQTSSNFALELGWA